LSFLSSLSKKATVDARAISISDLGLRISDWKKRTTPSAVADATEDVFHERTVPEACEAGDSTPLRRPVRKHQESLHTDGVSPQRRATATPIGDLGLRISDWKKDHHPGQRLKIQNRFSRDFCRNEPQKCRKRAFRVSFSAIFRKSRLPLHLT